MPFFKYYRPNFYFEKSLRYNEIYFASTEELNDPLDLALTPYFSDNQHAWATLLREKSTLPTWDMSNTLDTTCQKLASELNDFFKLKCIDEKKTIKSFIDTHTTELEPIFKRHIIESAKLNHIPDNPSLFKNQTTEVKSKICVLSLAEKLSKGWNKRFYSCSFSMAALSPMMWAHYAEGFKGCVIIYAENTDNSISLKSHPFSELYQNYGLAKINYTDTEKKICILEQVTNTGDISSPLLTKNSFWSYEKEVRILMTETFDSIKLSMTDEMPKKSLTRIFHHEPTSIIGVIFGARCPKSYKDAIENTICEKYFPD